MARRLVLRITRWNTVPLVLFAWALVSFGASGCAMAAADRKLAETERALARFRSAQAARVLASAAGDDQGAAPYHYWLALAALLEAKRLRAQAEYAHALALAQSAGETTEE